MSEAESEDGIIQRVETFIQRCHDLDYVIKPEARNVTYSKRESDDPKDRTILSDRLALAISSYELNRENPDLRLSEAEAALLWITRAFSSGVVTEGPGLIRKHKEAEAKVAHLSTKVDELTAENLFLKAKIDLMDQGRKF